MQPSAPSLALHQDETAADGIRRIVADLIDDALWRLEHEDELGTMTSVHETRKRCKEVRGVIRLARGGLGEDRYRAANDTLRDAARLLSDLRDNQAMLSTFDALVNASADAIAPTGVGSVRNALRERAMKAGRATKLRKAQVRGAHHMLGNARAQVDTWEFASDDLEMFGWGLRRTYGRARAAMAAAAATSDPHVYHEWRKRVKYSWYQASVLERAAPSVLTPMADMRHRLSDGLGDLHDLDVIVEMLRSNPAEFGGTDQIAAVESIAKPLQHELERRVLKLGRRLYSESVDAHSDRIMGYLAAWQDAGAELEIGEIGELFGVDDELGALTKGELQQLAKHAEIRGRWSMGRKELLAALRASGSRSGRFTGHTGSG